MLNKIHLTITSSFPFSDDYSITSVISILIKEYDILTSRILHKLYNVYLKDDLFGLKSFK